MPSPVDLLRDLIRCRSVTPEEGGALTLLADLLSGAGFSVDRPVFSEDGTPDVHNLFARIGSAAPCLVFAGHTDVVPPGDVAAWSHPPFAGEVADGLVFGRGACDMKGGIAASVAAVLHFLATRGSPAGSIAFLITGDEEGPAINGTPKLLAWARDQGHRFDHCILGEPTSVDVLGDMMKIGRRGSLSGTLTVRGAQGHVAYPHRARNPIPPLMTAIQAILATPFDEGSDHFDPTNLEFTTVDVGNPSTNVIPATATARFNVRFNDLWTPETLRRDIERRVREAVNGFTIALDFMPCNAEVFLTEPGPFTVAVSEAIQAETGHLPRLSTSGGTSDARFVTAYCPVVEFGLVGRTMHGIDEHASTADVETLTRVYHRVIDAYFPG